ncbi:MAG TPA: hypothetical protein PKL02_05290 [Rectinema sp.]|nr:hypothetical protein [Rectinema sp.]HQH88158.1 hypothetical protein [Rectinema sp.]HQN03236.1 hypothetical protein [Rectinema sp.]
MKRFVGLLCLIIIANILVSCQSSMEEGKIQQLFDLGYGKSDSSIDISVQNKNSVDICLRKGIFHLLSQEEAKILRISSYGQTLAMWYDPKRGSAPLVLKDVQMSDFSSGKDLGRFAIQVSFEDPGHIASDSRQMLYVSDAEIVRRFDSDGRELPFLGQEGIGGIRFPVITSLDVLSNDDIAVSCSSESGKAVYFYDRNGTFLHVLKWDGQHMPIPVSIAENHPNTGGSSIIASLESFLPCFLNGRRVVMLKINYYYEISDPSSGVTISIEPVGGWIIETDASNGALLNSFPLQSSLEDLGIDQQMIAAQSNGIFCVRWRDKGLSGEVFRFNQQGKINGKLDFQVPDADASLIDMVVGDDGNLYMLTQLSTELKMYTWRILTLR